MAVSSSTKALHITVAINNRLFPDIGTRGNPLLRLCSRPGVQVSTTIGICEENVDS